MSESNKIGTTGAERAALREAAKAERLAEYYANTVPVGNNRAAARRLVKAAEKYNKTLDRIAKNRAGRSAK